MSSRRDARRFTRFARRICTEYVALREAGAVDGVRFLYGPASSLNDPNGVVILGINPGGEQDISDRLSTLQTGYYSESWTDGDYRSRVCTLMAKCFTLAGASDWRAAWDRCVTSNLIPFRAPSLSALANQLRCKRFGRALWHDIFAEIEPRIIVAFGKVPGNAVYAILKEGGANPRKLRSYTARTAAELWAFDGARGDGSALLVPHYAHGHGVRLPHEVQAMATDLAPYLRPVITQAVKGGFQAFPFGQTSSPQVQPALAKSAPAKFPALEGDWRQEALSRFPQRGWKHDVIERIPFRRRFRAEDIFVAHGDDLQKLHPGHNNVRGGITTVLGWLIRDGIVARVDQGLYVPAKNGHPVL